MSGAGSSVEPPRQISLCFDEKVFLYDAVVFFKRTLNPVHVIAVSVGHRGNDPVIAMSLGAKEHIRNPGHHFTNAELAHRILPPSLTICGTSPSYCCLSLGGDFDEKKK